MTRQTRRFIFYGLVVAFAVITPLTIMYATGYSYDWQKQAVVQTGGIYLKSMPSGTQITINGGNEGTAPRLISRLTPHNYNVVVSKEGYCPWEKTLEVSPKIVTEARNIFLFPKEINPELITTTSTSSLEDFLETVEQRQNKSQAAQIASSTAGWLLNSGFIYFISQSDFVLYRQDLTGLNITQLSKEPLPAGRYRLFTNDGSYFLALSEEGILSLLNNVTGLFDAIAQEVKNVAASSDNKKFLYWNDNEIWVYYLQDILSQPYKKAGDKELITRYGQKISQALFYPNNEYVAFVVGDQIKITELDGRDRRNTIDFLQAKESQIYFDQRNGYLYYLTGNQIFRVSLD